MASRTAAYRLSCRLASRRVASDGAIRSFRTCAPSYAAQNFVMPALSPTMTEGNIATWKVKEGESFAAGDVLLEIETDKATMDVEAQDEGIMMKIMAGDGAKGVQVGTRIGVLAEPGDDIESLEIPADESKPVSQTKSESMSDQQENSPSSKGNDSQQKPKPTGSRSGKAKSGQKAGNQKYPLYPSVTNLLKEHGLSESAIAEMTATGPQGRLLKGDVLAYLGTVAEDRPAASAQRFEHNSHLDLSNIKPAKPKSKPSPDSASAKSQTDPAASTSLPRLSVVSLSVSLNSVKDAQRTIQEKSDTKLPVFEFIRRAAKRANEALPLSDAHRSSSNELFNDLVGLCHLNPRVSRGSYFPRVEPLSSTLTPKPALRPIRADIIDVLTPKSGASRVVMPPKTTASQIETITSSVLSLDVSSDEEKRAFIFLERMKNTLEDAPGSLVP